MRCEDNTWPCSAHFDVDASFGSLGSFFDFWPCTGSYEVNPPFVDSVMIRAVQHCEALLKQASSATCMNTAAMSSQCASSANMPTASHTSSDNSTRTQSDIGIGDCKAVVGTTVKNPTTTSSKFTEPSSLLKTDQPLSFAVVLPGWSESAAYQALVSSPFNTGQILVAACDHGYVDGAQHQRRDRHRASPYDTIVAFLQNSAARKRWPVTEAALYRLRTALARGIPTAQEAARRMAAGRGTAPEDGGGGVYRGKKKKRRQLKEKQ